VAEREPLIPKHGGYRKLKSFQVAQLVYDVTVRFCDRYISRRSRTHDQMVQAARSGVQNIAEGSQASGTSKKMELKLTNVARASLEELRLDYEDFLRQHGQPIWARDDPRRSDRPPPIQRRRRGGMGAAGAERTEWTEWTAWTGWSSPGVHGVHFVHHVYFVLSRDRGQCRVGVDRGGLQPAGSAVGGAGVGVRGGGRFFRAPLPAAAGQETKPMRRSRIASAT
jgi:four helix bundle protein